MDVRAYLLERTPLVERALDAVLPAATEPPVSLHSAMRHLLFPSGKMIRPAFAMAGAEAMGASPERALPVATAVELIHTYSLIHDDLPCMDDDDERRGRPAVHIAFGEAVAVLAGDALLALAFEVVARAEGEPAPLLAVSRDLAAVAGSLELVGGQVDDLQFETSEKGELEAARIESVHARKSAALIEISVASGARLAGADSGTIARLRRFGRGVGVAFQIADDLLDAPAEDEAGEIEPCSLLHVMSVEAASARAETLLESALKELDDLGEPAEPLRELARFAVRRSE
jgi:geranylgeranyl diphosphate synthase type II